MTDYYSGRSPEEERTTLGAKPSFTKEELVPLQSLPEYDFEVKPRLHWFQWFTYVIVVITCLAVVYSLGEVHYVIAKVGQAVQNFNNELGK